MIHACLRAVIVGLGIAGVGTTAVRGDIILSATDVVNTIIRYEDDTSVVELIAPQTAELPPEPGVTGVKLWGAVQWQNLFDGNSNGFGLSWTGSGSGTLTDHPIHVRLDLLVTVDADQETNYDLQVSTRWDFDDGSLLVAGYVVPPGAGTRHIVDTFSVLFPETYVGKSLASYEVSALLTMSAVQAGNYTLSVPENSIDVGTQPDVVVPEPGTVSLWCAGLLALVGLARRTRGGHEGGL